MSDLKRYEIGVDFVAPVFVPVETEVGDWVKYVDYARLKAEVERLTYVGDAMAMMVGHIEVKGDAHRMMLEFSNEWNAAKEGKQP